MSERHVFIADVHLRRDETAKRDALVRFIRSIAKSGEHLYILGDLFDVWIGPVQLEAEPELAPVVEAMDAFVKAGGRLVFFHGNRDFYMGNYLTRRLGARTVRAAATFDIGGRKVLLTHGESLCASDQLHRFTQMLLRSPILSTAFRFFPTHMKYGSSRTFRSISLRRNPLERRRPRGIDPAALRRLIRRGLQVVICGHIHESTDTVYRWHGRELRLIVLPPWTDKGWAMEYDAGEFRLRAVDFA